MFTTLNRLYHQTRHIWLESSGMLHRACFCTSGSRYPACDCGSEDTKPCHHKGGFTSWSMPISYSYRLRRTWLPWTFLSFRKSRRHFLCYSFERSGKKRDYTVGSSRFSSRVTTNPIYVQNQIRSPRTPNLLCMSSPISRLRLWHFIYPQCWSLPDLGIYMCPVEVFAMYVISVPCMMRRKR